MAIKNTARFSEIELCLHNYFSTNLAPVMKNVQDELSRKQMTELGEYRKSTAGILRQMANEAVNLPDVSMYVLKITGEWNSKTTEDYIDMCRKQIAGNKAIQHDLARMAAEWRTAVIGEIGRERYDSISKQLGGDLSMAYVDYRVEQQMIDRLVAQRMPKGTMDYIVRRAAEGSLFGLPQMLMKSPLDREIDTKCEKAYNPSIAEKGAAKAGSVMADAASMGCVSWGSLLKFGAADIVFSGVGSYLDSKNGGKQVTIEECISQGVFGSKTNVFTGFREKSREIKTWENRFILSLNDGLSKKMGILTKKPVFDLTPTPKWEMKGFDAMNHPKGRDPKYAGVPMVIAPGQEEAYLKEQARLEAERRKAEKSESKNTARLSADTENDEAREEAENPQAEGQQQAQQREVNGNCNGWAGLLSTIGLSGIGDIGHNLGYVISMLPDVLVGLFTGRTKSLALKDNLLPVASILAGIFVKNPILKMVLMGMGGANLLNKAGHEVLERQSDSTLQSHAQFKRYAEEALNPRIQAPTLQGSCLIMTIDRVPYSIALQESVVAAYQAGALPLSTLANAVLAKTEQSRHLAQQNYQEVAEREQQENAMAMK